MVDVGLIPQTKKVDGCVQRGFKIFLGGMVNNPDFARPASINLAYSFGKSASSIHRSTIP